MIKPRYKYWKGLIASIIILIVLMLFQIPHLKEHGAAPFILASDVYCECIISDNTYHNIKGIDDSKRYCNNCGADTNNAGGYFLIGYNHCQVCDEDTSDVAYHRDCGNRLEVISNLKNIKEFNFDSISQVTKLTPLMNLSMILTVFDVAVIVGFLLSYATYYNEWCVYMDTNAK